MNKDNIFIKDLFKILKSIENSWEITKLKFLLSLDIGKRIILFSKSVGDKHCKANPLFSLFSSR